MAPLSRRRLLTIAAGSAAIAALARPATALSSSLVQWQGAALGAEARLLLPRDGAGPAIDLCLAEVERLEGILSLYRPDSALCTLNRTGTLSAPPPELVAVLSTALALARETGGAFDPTVQPLWTEGKVALPRVGWRGLEVDSQRIRFTRPGMAVTLNGIAQGYVTDRVADLLRRRGYDHVLVNLGETRALGPRPDGRPWRVAPDAASPAVPLSAGALATSDPATGAIVDPRTGAPARSWSRVSVACPTAMIADGLSTALCLLSEAEAVPLLQTMGATRAQVTDTAGKQTEWPAPLTIVRDRG